MWQRSPTPCVAKADAEGRFHGPRTEAARREGVLWSRSDWMKCPVHGLYSLTGMVSIVVGSTSRALWGLPTGAFCMWAVAKGCNEPLSSKPWSRHRDLWGGGVYPNSTRMILLAHPPPGCRRNRVSDRRALWPLGTT